MEDKEQEEWEGAVKGFIFTLDDIIKSPELFLQLM